MPLLPAPSVRRAATGVSLMFFTNGVLFSALLPRYPEFKAEFGLTNTQFGLLVIIYPVGALITAGFAGRAIRRFGTLRTNAVGSLVIAAAMTGAAASHRVELFALALLVAGSMDSLVDAAQNVQGVLVEHWRGRSFLNSFHAVWSAGAATGGAVGAVGVALDIAPGTQMAINGAVWGVVAVLACTLAAIPDEIARTLDVREGHDPSAGGSGRGHAWKLLLPLAVLAICGTLVEDVANNWAVLYLGGVAGAPAALAGLGVTVVLVAQLVGRFVGDPMTDRWGRAAVARTGGLLIAAGGLLVVLTPGYPLTFVGFALTGLGCATLVPAAFAAAGRLPGLPEGTGIALLGWLMRLGFLLTSPAIGRLSDLTSLQVAMLIPVGAGLLAAVVAHTQLSAATPRGPVGTDQRGS